MKIKCKFGVIDTDKEGVMLCFENDEERIKHGNNLLNVFKPKEGQRKYAVFPDGSTNEEMMEFMNYGEEIKDDDALQLIHLANDKNRIIFHIDVGETDKERVTELIKKMMEEYRNKE